MAYSVRNKKGGLLRSVEERVLFEKSQKEQKKHDPYLDKDCISSILVRLPVDVIHSSRLVCKLWYDIISNPVFVDSQFSRSESVLIFLKSVPKERLYPYTLMAEPPEKRRTFSVEANFLQTKAFPFFEQSVGNTSSKFQIHFMEFNEGRMKVGEYKVCCLGKIRASCNGLILLDNKLKKGGLIVMNPVTKKVMALPLGTLFPSHNESYGFAFSSSCAYKVVHLFRDELGYVNCEILNLRTRFWREVNGPMVGLFGWFGYKPILAIGALHWIPQIDHNDYIVSMDVDSEKFHTTSLPKSCRTHDRIIEMCGCLCLVTHEGLYMDIWSLKSLFDSCWTKKHRITKGVILDMVPIFSLRINGDLVLRREENGAFYVYDFKLDMMREVEMDEENMPFSDLYLPHVSSLISWTRGQDKYD